MDFARPSHIKIELELHHWRPRHEEEEEEEGGGILWKITGRAFHRAGPNRESAMHDRKIQGMKLATAPLLCDLSPKTSVAPLLYFFFFAILSFHYR